jgi:exopolysaccharide biosynthesis WecB/TagA/CpsF family protein
VERVDHRIIDFLGLPIDDLNKEQAAAAIVGRPPGAAFAYVVTPNAQHYLGLARNQSAWREAYGSAWIRLADGHVVQPLARLLLGLSLPHASGSDITQILVHRYIAPDDSVTVIGGSPALEAELRNRFGWKRLAIYNPPHGLMTDEAARQGCVDFIAANPARYVFLTVGSPQSEWIASMAARRGGLTGTALCVGGSLMFATGLIKRAPNWIRSLGLEGFFRLAQKPRTHFRRVFVESIPIIGFLISARLGKSRILPQADQRQ